MAGPVDFRTFVNNQKGKMKEMKASKWTGLGLAMLATAVALLKLPAQSLDSQEATTAAEPLVMEVSDLAVVPTLSEAGLAAFLSALDATPQIAYEAIGATPGTFYSLKFPDSAPLPADLQGYPVWPMHGFYLLNDVDAPVAKTSTLNQSKKFSIGILAKRRN